jgi:hypothetical protein
MGAEVTGVCSKTKAQVMWPRGADHVLDHTQDDLADEAVRCELILDVGGNSRLSRLRPVLSRRETIALEVTAHDRCVVRCLHPTTSLPSTASVPPVRGHF